MSITGLLLAIAILLAVLAAVGVRVALSLQDIGTSLDRIADGLGESGRTARAVQQGIAPPLAAKVPEGQSPAGTIPDDTEIAAVIAAAARFAHSNEQERMHG